MEAEDNRKPIIIISLKKRMSNEEWVHRELDEGYSTPLCLKVIAILLAKLLDRLEVSKKE